MATEPHTVDSRVAWKDVAAAWRACKHVTLYDTKLALTTNPGFAPSLVMRATANADERCYLAIYPTRPPERTLSFKLHSHGAVLYHAETPLADIFGDRDLLTPKTAVLAVLRHVAQHMVQQLTVNGR